MNPMEWLRGLFVPKENSEEDFYEEHREFAWTEHLRIVLAILIVLVSALAMWWILM